MADDIVVPFDRKAAIQKAQEVGHAQRRAKVEEVGPRDPDAPTRWQRLLSGDLTVEDLDIEELTKRRCRDRLGGFTGRPSSNIPRNLEAAMRKEFMKRMEADLASAVPVAIKALSDVAKSGLGKDKVAASALILDRGLGKVVDKVEVTTYEGDPWDILEGMVVTSQENLPRMIEPKAAGE